MSDMNADVARAVVTITKKGGHGVWVEGNLILTAAHLLDFECSGGMVLGDYYVEEIETAQEQLKVRPLAVEPVSDIAVLGSLDDQSFPKESVAFVSFCCQDIVLVPLCSNEFELFQGFPVYIYSHIGTWVKGEAKQCEPNAPMLWVEADEQIQGGASGGPIINEKGELVGIVSNFSEVNIQQSSSGLAPRPHQTLPIWAIRRILKG